MEGRDEGQGKRAVLTFSCANRDALFSLHQEGGEWAFFSSKFIHVKKGALFSLRPNNLELGGKLAIIAMNILAGDVTKRGMTPLREVQTALNVRTASHIGLNIGSQQQRNFNYIFPEQ